MTKPNKRRFQSVRIVTTDAQTKSEHIDLDPTLLSAADLEKICKSLDSIRATIMLEFARRAGYIRQEPILWLDPSGRTLSSGTGKEKKEIKIDFGELEDLAKML